MTEAVAIVHIGTDGMPIGYAFAGDDRVFRFLVVDERAPHDRVYQMTQQSEPAEIKAIIGDGPVGSARDERHAAIAHLILAADRGEAHLTLVEEPQP